MATTPEIRTKFTLDGLRQAATGLRGFGQSIADTLGDARRRGGVVFDPLSKGLSAVERKTRTVAKEMAKLGAVNTFRSIRLGALGASVAVGGLATKMSAVSAAAVKAAKESAESLKALSVDAQRIGGSTTDVAVLGYAAELTGTDRDELVTQIATISNEFLTLQDNIRKSKETYTDFLTDTRTDIAAAKRAKDVEKLNEIQKNFREAELEARKGSVQDIDDRIRQIQNVLRNGIFAQDYYKALRPGSLPEEFGKATNRNSGPAIAMLRKELRELQKARDEFWSTQSLQAQALHELEKYGVDIRRASRGGVDGLLEISDAFRRVENPSQRARIAMRLFGEDAGVRLIPLLNGGREAIERYNRVLQASGAIASPQDIQNAEDYSRAVLNLKTAFSGVKMTIGRTLVPDLTRSSNELTAWLIRSREQIAQHAIKAFNDSRVLARDAANLFGGRTDDIQTKWLDVTVNKAAEVRDAFADVRQQARLLFKGEETDYGWLNVLRDGLVSIKGFASDVVKQVRLLWNGKDSDYEWINAIRDGLRSVKAFAEDAWKQISLIAAGKATDYEWLNDLVAGVQWFTGHLKAAFELFKTTLGYIKDAVKPILDFVGTDFTTTAMFVGILRLTGLLGGLTAAAGLAATAVGKIGSAGLGAVASRAGSGAAASAATAAAGSSAPAIAAAIASGGDTLADKIRRAWTAETTVGAISGSVAQGVRSGASSIAGTPGAISNGIRTGASAIQGGAVTVRDGFRDRWAAAREEVERRRANPGPGLKERLAEAAAGARQMRDAVISATADAAKATAALPGQAAAATAEGFKNAAKTISDTAEAAKAASITAGNAAKASAISTANATRDAVVSSIKATSDATRTAVASARAQAVAFPAVMKTASIQTASSIKDGLVTSLTMARMAAVDSGKATVQSFKSSGAAAVEFAKETGSRLKSLATDTDAWRGRIAGVGTSFKSVGGSMIQSIGAMKLSLGGVIESLLVLGTTAVAAFQLGQAAAQWWFQDTMKAYDAVIDGQAALIRANDEVYLRTKLNQRDEASRGFRDGYWKKQGILQGGWQGMSAAERAEANLARSNEFMGWKSDYRGEDFAAFQRESEARRAAQPVVKRVAVDLNVAGRTTTLEGDEVGVMQFTRSLEQATRGY